MADVLVMFSNFFFTLCAKRGLTWLPQKVMALRLVRCKPVFMGNALETFSASIHASNPVSAFDN